MKLKEQKKFGILWLSIGAALFLAGLLLGETGIRQLHRRLRRRTDGLSALVRLLRVRRLSRDPEKAADYDASLKRRAHGVCRQQGAQHDASLFAFTFSSPRRCWRSWCSIRRLSGRCSAA